MYVHHVVGTGRYTVHNEYHQHVSQRLHVYFTYPPFHHVAPRQDTLTEAAPASFQRQFKQGPKQAGGRLTDVHHVCRQRKPFQGQPADVGLQQTIDFGGPGPRLRLLPPVVVKVVHVVHRFTDGYRYLQSKVQSKGGHTNGVCGLDSFRRRCLHTSTTPLTTPLTPPPLHLHTPPHSTVPNTPPSNVPVQSNFSIPIFHWHGCEH
jgi:hypothetical protein